MTVIREVFLKGSHQPEVVSFVFSFVEKLSKFFFEETVKETIAQIFDSYS
jgi:hypothetical protein